MKRILFIGNSYTFFHDMPKSLFAPMLREAGVECEVTAVTRGGYYLSQFADPENEEGKRLRKTVEGKQYDCVILQDQSCNPVKNEERFLQGVKALKALLEEQTAHFVLYSTWGRKEGSPQLAEMHLTSEEMTERLHLAYHRAADTFGMRVADVGLAFAKERTESPEIELYDPDLSHPSLEGSRLAARVICDAVMAEI